MKLAGKIVFASGVSVNFDIWSLDLATGELTQLTSGDYVNDFPRWSPDGTRIAYVSTQEDSIPSLWTMRADGSEKRRLTTNLYCQAPSWAPNGRELLFTGNADDATEINVCTIDVLGGSAVTFFKHAGLETTPSYSPDGKRILFSTPSQNGDGSLASSDTDIVEFTIASGAFKVLFAHPANDYGAVYSPDGSRIAFVSHRNQRSPEEYGAAYQRFRDVITQGTNAEAREAMIAMKSFEQDGDIFVAKSDGSDLVKLTSDSLADKAVCWSPCGGYLMYTSASRGNNEAERLKVIDAQSGARVPLSYDRTPFEKEIGAYQFLNATWRFELP